MLIRESFHKAHKDYDCMASEWLDNTGAICGHGLMFSFSEMRQIVKARQKLFKINKGDTYLRQVISDGGELYYFVAIPEMHKICLKYNIYDT